MPIAVDRRRFGKALLASGMGLGHAGNWAFAKPIDDDREWAIPVLGDLHYAPVLFQIAYFEKNLVPIMRTRAVLLRGNPSEEN